VIYARQSSGNKAALQSQIENLRRYATAKGYQDIVSEIASGVSDDRKLDALLKRRDFDLLLVEHKDRLTRLGFRWFEALCPFKIEVVNYYLVPDLPKRNGLRSQ
jgi:predicted site-specific integrase-resolvase